MPFKSCSLPFVATMLCYTAVSFADQLYPNQFEGIVGVSFATSNLSHLHLGSGITAEVDTLESTGTADNVLWGAAYAYDILQPLRGKPMADDILARVLVGVNVYGYNTTDSGNVFQYGNPAMENYTYKFRLETLRGNLSLGLDFFSPVPRIYPFFQISGGVARVVTHYTDTPNDPAMGGGVTIPNYTNTTGTFSAGAGLKYLMMDSLQLSVSYLYTYFGTVKSADEALTDVFYTNSGVVGLAWIF